MKLLTRIGWGLIAVGAFLMIAMMTPLGLPLMVIGVPMVFVGSTVRAVRAHAEVQDDDATDGKR